ncbi:ATP-binding protein [uncultured Polaribacter sp.]|uniref:tetratricopeptide repeat-containing sensor histidine kinase n=1 Tax=uncultured Polaribacter sp. TaxID=174711 RepID=UPI00263971EF|nr:ATP-binding protein [uncultured Polaribacter sp.]
MKNKTKLFLLIFISFNLYQLKATPKKKYVTEEVSNNETSSVFIVKSDSIFEKKYNLILDIYRKEKYIEALNLALSLYDFIKDDKLMYESYLTKTLIADIYDKTNNHKRALSNYKEALLLINNKVENNDINYIKSKDFAKIYLRIGSSFQKKLAKDSAKYYFKKIENLPSLNNDILKYKASAFTNLSGLYEMDSIYDKAILYAEKSIKIISKTNNKIGESKAKMNLANIYLSLNDFQQSKEIYLEGIQLIKNDNNQNAVSLKADLYYNLAWAMRNLKEYEAYDYQELSYEIEDGIRDKEVRRMAAEIAAKYNIKDVKKEEENKRLKNQRTFWLFAIGSLVIILSLLYFLNFYKLKQKNLRLKLSQTQLIQNQNIEKLKSESQTRILNATIDGKESERKEIAETLHDSVSALLSSANLHLIATRQQFNGKTPIEIDKTQHIIAEASQKIRDLSHTLVSSVLLKFGLNYAVNDMATKYSNSAINIETNIYGLRRYHQNFEIKIYNIIQEFVNNILKHSKAKNAMLKLYEEHNKICFEISDDGIGFNKKKISDKDGLGINQIDARIQMMNGKFQIESIINLGTTIFVELPVVEKETFNHV